MKKLVSFVHLVLLLGLLINTSAYAQLRRNIAVGDFLWEGEFWQDELGAFASDYLIRKLQSTTRFDVLKREEINIDFEKAGVQNAFNASPDLLYEALRFKNVAYVVAGRIKKIMQIQEIAGRVTVRVTVDLRIINMYSGMALPTIEERDDAVRTEKIAVDTEYSKKAAEEMLGSTLTNISRRIISLINSQQNRLYY